MAKTVTDAAIMLGALEGASPDSHDSATTKCQPPAGRDYTQFLKADGLKGMRIGIPRAFYYDAVTPPKRFGAPPETAGAGRRGGGGGFGSSGLTPEQKRLMTEAIEILKLQGAVIVDPADIPSIVETDPDKNFLLWSQCSGLANARGKDANCSVVLKYGMKRDFNTWLETLGPSAPVKSLTELREWNITHTNAGAIRYGQSQLDISDEMNLQADKARYEADRKKDLEMAGTNGIDAVMKSQHLDAILFPGASGASIAAKPGYPTVIVPFGFVPNTQGGAFPAGFDPKPAPFGVSFTGMSCSEPDLLKMAYSFEQATKRRVKPIAVP